MKITGPKNIRGKIKVPPSKSITHRALICAALAEGESTIINPLICEDTLATASVLEALGVSIKVDSHGLKPWHLGNALRANHHNIRPQASAWYSARGLCPTGLPDGGSQGESQDPPLTLASVGLRPRERIEKGRLYVRGGPWHAPAQALDCLESATTYRMMSAITNTLGIHGTLTSSPALMKRMVANNITSQFLSGELLAAPLAKKETVIEPLFPLVSKPYVELTLDIQKKFGLNVEVQNNFSRFKIAPQPYRPAILEIEGDWSSAAFFIAAGCLKGEVVLEGLKENSLQGDRQIVTILKEMGADIFWDDGKLVARASSLRAIQWDLSQTPDLYPIAAVLGALAKGKSVLTGIDRLRFKESDRVAAMEKILADPFVVDSTDHRVVMAAAILNLATGGKMMIKNPQCVAKSFPEFWETLTSLISEDEQ